MEEATLTSSARLRAILLLIFLKPSFSKTVVVNDAVVQANVVTLFLGDTLLFKGDDNFHVIYIFRSRKAFQLCNLSKATILHSVNTTTSFTWHPSVPGNFYFSSCNTTNNDQCDDWKVKVRVMGLKLPPSISSQAPSPTPGGDVRCPSPQQGPTPTAEPPMSLPTSTPSSSTSSSPSRFPGGGSDVPFVSSDPVIPRTTGGLDGTNIDLPIPVTGDGNKVTTTTGGIKTMMLVSFMMETFAFLNSRISSSEAVTKNINSLPPYHEISCSILCNLYVCQSEKVVYASHELSATV